MNNKTRLELLKQAKSSGYTGSYIDLFQSHNSSVDNHTEANSKKEIQRGLEGAPYGASAKLNFDTFEAHSLEGRQDHPVKVTADGNYQGILFPGEEKFIVDTSMEVEETPMLTYGGVAIKQEEVKSQLDNLIPPMVEGRSLKEYQKGGTLPKYASGGIKPLDEDGNERQMPKIDTANSIITNNGKRAMTSEEYAMHAIDSANAVSTFDKIMHYGKGLFSDISDDSGSGIEVRELNLKGKKGKGSASKDYIPEGTKKNGKYLHYTEEGPKWLDDPVRLTFEQEASEGSVKPFESGYEYISGQGWTYKGVVPPAPTVKKEKKRKKEKIIKLPSRSIEQISTSDLEMELQKAAPFELRGNSDYYTTEMKGKRGGQYIKDGVNLKDQAGRLVWSGTQAEYEEKYGNFLERGTTEFGDRRKNRLYLKKYQGDEGSGIVDPDYKFTRGDYQVNDTDISEIDFDLLYNAVESHEHRGAIDTEGYNSFIRTKAKKSGSSAYGPIQLTGDLLSNITTPGVRRFYDVENIDTEYHKKLVSQSKLFLKYGGGDYMKYYDEETGQYDGLDKEDILNTYEYGGEGFLGDTDEDRENYRILGIEMLKGGYRKEIEEHKASDNTHLYNMIKNYGTGTDAYAKAVEKKYNALVKERDDKAKKLNEQQKLILDRAIKNVQMKLDSVKNNK